MSIFDALPKAQWVVLAEIIDVEPLLANTKFYILGLKGAGGSGAAPTERVRICIFSFSVGAALDPPDLLAKSDILGHNCWTRLLVDEVLISP